METDRVEASGAESATSNLLHDYLFACRDRTTKAFDETNGDSLSEAVSSIGKILSMHVVLFAKGAHIVGLRLDAFALSKTALDTLVSALHLVRHRANIEVACLLRSALESGCTALHISRDSNAYEQFLKGSYQSTRSISAAKKDIPLVGELWGALSRAAVHVNHANHGPNWRRDEDDGNWLPTVELNFRARTAKPVQDSIALTLISLTAEIVARTQELSLLEEDPARSGWRQVPGTPMIFCSGTENAIDKQYELFLSLAQRARHSES